MFIERLLTLINEKGISKKQFSEDVQINKNQVKRWQDTGTLPNRTTLTVIASYFDVSVDYLLGNTDIKKENSPTEMSAEEQEILNDFNSLSQENKDTVIKMIQALKKL